MQLENTEDFYPLSPAVNQGREELIAVLSEQIEVSTGILLDARKILTPSQMKHLNEITPISSRTLVTSLKGDSRHRGMALGHAWKATIALSKVSSESY